MSIRDENGKLAIAPGEWQASCAPFDMAVTASGNDILGARNFASIGYGLIDEANIELAAEAGTVTNECGRTPRELLDLCRGLRAALDKCEAYLRDEGHLSWADWVFVEMNKSEGV